MQTLASATDYILLSFLQFSTFALKTALFAPVRRKKGAISKAHFETAPLHCLIIYFNTSISNMKRHIFSCFWLLSTSILKITAYSAVFLKISVTGFLKLKA